MLSDAQMRQFEDEGYTILDDILSAEDIAAITAEYAARMDAVYAAWHKDGLVPAPEGRGFFDKLGEAAAAGLEWFQPLDISLPFGEIAEDTPMHTGPAVFDMIRNPRILDAMAQLLGPEITSNPIQHVRIKPPPQMVAQGETRAHITSTDWHQDRAVAMHEADTTDMVTVWLAITDATVENGCLQVLPGKTGMVTHCPRETQARIGTGLIDLNRAKPLPIPAGSAILFHPLTPHGSLDNTSQGFRWSFDLRYQVTGQHTGRPQFPEFTVRSAARPDTVLDDWREWSAMWDATRAALAQRPPSVFHRWDASAEVCA